MRSKPNKMPGIAGDLAAMRRELASAERQLRKLAAHAAENLERAERAARLDALDACQCFDRIRPRAEARLAAIRDGVVLPGRQTPERFPGEARLAEMALRRADFADAAYTVIHFARLPDRLRYLRGGYDRDSLLLETLERGGVYNDRNFFIEVITNHPLSS